jgi:hypothetical protein
MQHLKKFGLIILLTGLTFTVFATRRYSDVYLYASNDGVYFELLGFGASLTSNLTTENNGNAQCSITDSYGETYRLYYNDESYDGVYYPVYPDGSW